MRRPPRGKSKPNPPRPEADEKKIPGARSPRPFLGKANPPRPDPEIHHPPPGVGGPSLPVVRADRSRAAPDTPAESLRGRVWVADQGRCVGCSRSLGREAGVWSWHAHHPIPQQVLKREGLSFFCGDERAAVLLCRRCHEQHESWTRPVAYERLPARTLGLAEFLGPYFVDVVERLHPRERSRP